MKLKHQRLAIILLVLFVPCRSLLSQWVEKPTAPGTDGSEAFYVFANRLYVGGGDGPMSWTSDAGDTWHYAADGLPGLDGVISLATIGNMLVAGMSYNGIFYSTDSGNSWNRYNWNKVYDPAFPAMTEHDGYMFAGSNGQGIYRSSDSGRNWELDTVKLSTGEVGAYSFAEQDSLLFAGSPTEYVFRTSDDGKSWDTERLTKDWTVGDIVQSLAVMGHVVLAGTSGGLYRSTDLGSTWNQLDTTLFGYHHSPLSLVTANGYVIAGTDNTILRSHDSGITWEPFDQGWTSGENAAFLITSGGYLFAGRYDGPGLWRRPLSDLAGVAEVPQASDAIHCYPNPLSQSTTISFTPEKSGYADVSIVNLLGVEVAHLFSGELAAGEHSFVWSKPAGLLDGVYECLVRMDGRVETLPVVRAHH